MNLNNFRFYSSENNSLNSGILKTIKDLVVLNRGAFELANHFFYTVPDNQQDIKEIKKKLEKVKVRVELDLEFDELDNEFDTKIVDKLIGELTKLFSLDNQLFTKIRNDYIEAIIFFWKTRSGKYSKVFHEPEISYKRKKCFSKGEYSNIKCDVVYCSTSRVDKSIEMYECKTTMKVFIKYFFKNFSNTTSPSALKNIRSSRRKQAYLSAFYNLFSSKFKKEDLHSYQVAYVTLAPQNQIKYKNEEIKKIGPVNIITREKLSSLYQTIINHQ